MLANEPQNRGSIAVAEAQVGRHDGERRAARVRVGLLRSVEHARDRRREQHGGGDRGEPRHEPPAQDQREVTGTGDSAATYGVNATTATRG